MKKAKEYINARTIMLCIILIVKPVPASAWVVEAIAVGSAALGIVNSVIGGRAAKAAAQAQAAQMAAIFKELAGIQLKLDLVLEKLDAIEAALDNLPRVLEMREAMLSASRSMEVMLEYAEIINAPEFSSDEKLSESIFQRLNIEQNAIDRHLPYFRRLALKGDLQAIMCLVTLQEAFSFAYRAIAVCSVNDSGDRELIERGYGALASRTPLDEFDRLMAEAGMIDSRKGEGNDTGAPEKVLPGVGTFRALRRFLFQQKEIWETLIAPNGGLAKAIVRGTPVHRITKMSPFFSSTISDATLVYDTMQYINSQLSAADPSYSGLLVQMPRKVVLVLIPMVAEFQVKNMQPWFQYPPDIIAMPGGAFIWNRTMPEASVYRWWERERSTHRFAISDDYRFIGFHAPEIEWVKGRNDEIEPLPMNWEQEGFIGSIIGDFVGSEIYEVRLNLFPEGTKEEKEDEYRDLIDSFGEYWCSDHEALYRMIGEETRNFERMRPYDIDQLSSIADFIQHPDTSALNPSTVKEYTNFILNVITYTAACNAAENTRQQLGIVDSYLSHRR